MTPAARVATAIEVLDRVLDGEPAEKVLTSWARANRYAGSKDRAALRDHVFDALRCLHSYAARGGAMTGRGVMLGALRSKGEDPAAFFTGEGYAPSPLTPTEQAAGLEPEGADALDCPAWLMPSLQASLKEDFEPVLRALQARAQVFVRVNLRKTTVDGAVRRLSEDGIETTPSPLSPTALEVTAGARCLQASAALAEGWVEVQDAASQALVDTLPITDDMRILDYCAGGGGKTLAMAGRVAAQFYAHDVAAQRLQNIVPRAGRAGVNVTLTHEPAKEAPYDLVLCDVPCSGSGAWRRTPEAKWRLDAAGLRRLVAMQMEILQQAKPLVRRGGTLAYATCSLLDAENGGQIAAFLAENPDWRVSLQRRWTPLDGGDGFYIAHLTQYI